MTSNNTLYIFGAAVVGIVSAAGVYIVEHLRQERRRHAMAQDLARLDQQLITMRKELDQLRQLQKEKNAQRLRKGGKRANRTISSKSSMSEDYNSALELDSSDMEFYDLSDDEEPSEVNQDFNLIDDKLNSGKVQLVLEALDTLTGSSQEDPEVLWRIGKAHHKLFSAETDQDARDEQLHKGLEVCQKSVKINDNVAEAHKWLAIIIGAQCDTQPIKEKISNAYLFKQHLDRALQLNPDDATLHHLLGRFAFESASLKWYERKIAEAFFAEPPKSTYEEALDYAINAEKLVGKDWKENKLLIAKCEIALGKYEDAVRSLEVAEAMDDKEGWNQTIQAEIKTLLQKYNSYR